ncbi:MAG: MmcQ/YjbR family DNA-binding protein [Jhaorihella sp.]
MTGDQFNAFCGSLPATTHVVQWGGSDVWKVGGKVFAICGWGEADPAFTFKTGEIAYEVLTGMAGLRPAPYLASRGFKWVQHFAPPGLPDAELRGHIRASYEMVRDSLSRRKRAELGLTGQ